MQMKKLSPTDRRMVCVVLFILVFIGDALVVVGWDVPSYTISSADVEVFKLYEALQPGDKVMDWSSVIGQHWQDMSALIIAATRYMANKRVIHLFIPTTAEALYYCGVVSEAVWGLEYWKNPDYGVIFAITPVYATTITPARNIRTTWTRDNFGNTWDSLPMMKNFNGAKDAKMLMASYSLTLVAQMVYEFPTQVKVCLSVTNSQAFSGAYYTSGAVQGHGLGARSGHAFEILANFPPQDRIARLIAVPQLFVALSIFIGAIVCNYIYYVKKVTPQSSMISRSGTPSSKGKEEKKEGKS